jgi:hypothetical protein
LRTVADAGFPGRELLDQASRAAQPGPAIAYEAVPTSSST